MIFKSLQNIETAWRMTRLVALVAIACSALTTIYSVYSSHQAVERSRERIYVLDRGKSLMLALSQDMAQNRPVEARSHIKLFHELFFTLSPDNDAIKMNLERSFYLADASAYKYYNDLKEAGFYRRLIATNTTQRIVVDSIACEMVEYPYVVQVFARLQIMRASNITTRSLVSICELTNEVRSDNNPHGFMIRNFVVRQNEDVSKEKRSR
jgi:conjugative transposon TraK protein